MIGLLRGELVKIVTVRTLPGFAVVGVVLSVANVLIVALASGTLDEVGEKEEALAGLPVLLLLLGLAGAAGEYRHRTAAPAALVARCGRGRLLLVRAGAYALAGLGVGALMMGVSLGTGLPLLGRQPGPDLDSGEVVAVVAGCLSAAVLSAITGVALGALVRHQVAGVIGALILNFVANPLIGIIDESAANYTPFGASAVLARMKHDTSLSAGGAAIVLAGWALLLLAAAAATERRRDLA
ncbi:MAG TPA: hypothetical protein VFX70_17900 [Mycobacteriales bacterium]|nr:hypothetical protein [Mycobacteriales bacterium]